MADMLPMNDDLDLDINLIAATCCKRRSLLHYTCAPVPLCYFIGILLLLMTAM